MPDSGPTDLPRAGILLDSASGDACLIGGLANGSNRSALNRLKRVVDNLASDKNIKPLQSDRERLYVNYSLSY